MGKTCERPGFRWDELNRLADGRDPAPGDVARMRGDYESLRGISTDMGTLEGAVREISIGSTEGSTAATETLALVQLAADDIGTLSAFVTSMAGVLNDWASALEGFQANTEELHGIWSLEKENFERQVDRVSWLRRAYYEADTPGRGVSQEQIDISWKLNDAMQEQDRLENRINYLEETCLQENIVAATTANSVISSIATLAGIEAKLMDVPPVPSAQGPGGFFYELGESAQAVSFVLGLGSLLAYATNPLVGVVLDAASTVFGVIDVIHTYNQDREAVRRGEMTQDAARGRLLIGLGWEALGLIPFVKEGKGIVDAIKAVPRSEADELKDYVILLVEEMLGVGFDEATGQLTEEEKSPGSEVGQIGSPDHVELPTTREMPEIETPSCPA